MVLVRFYKIWSELGNMVYIGSTEKTLNERFCKHTSGFKTHSLKEASKLLFEAYGVENCQISEIFAVLCETKSIRNALEASYIKHWRERQEFQCVNICLPGRTSKQYRIDNNEFVKKINHEYRQKNKDQITAYRENNRDKMNEKYICQICDGQYTRANKACHIKSKKHQSAIIQA